jgi:four helix bundle protein
MVKSYRDLKVWQKVIELIPEVYGLMKSFPKTEQYALMDQLRRAVVSVAANIAEGQARQHRKEFLQGLYIARGSLAEVDTLLEVALRLSYITREQQKSTEKAIMEIRRMLEGLIKSMQVH